RLLYSVNGPAMPIGIMFSTKFQLCVASTTAVTPHMKLHDCRRKTHRTRCSILKPHHFQPSPIKAHISHIIIAFTRVSCLSLSHNILLSPSSKSYAPHSPLAILNP